MNKKGFVFIETIVVTCFLIVSLMVLYSLFVSSNNTELRRLRYDDTSKVYEAYYLYQYLDSYQLGNLIQNLDTGTKFEVIYPGRTDIFGSDTLKESILFENLWTELNVQRIYLLPGNISTILDCTSEYATICSNTNLVSYLNTLDDGENYYFIVEFANARDGSGCTDEDCVYSYAYFNINKGNSNISDEDNPCVQQGVDFVQCSIIDEVSSTECPSVSADGSVLVASEGGETGYICSAPDDYGTSYYYRGNVTNNYVSFAGYYWRIIRINGDGTIRMIYDGRLPHPNGEVSSDRSIAYSTFNSVNTDNAYVGYMYGTVGASNYTDAHANIHDSTIKTVIDNWYENQLSGTKYESYLADVVFCNDRTVVSGGGYSLSETNYRWNEGPWSPNPNYPNLKCAQKNDRFTVNDTSFGNGDLTYPIALITRDESVLAGYYNHLPYYDNYLYGGAGDDQIWTMSPGFVTRWYAYVHIALGGAIGATDTFAVKPVINLKAGSLKGGTGTMENPYRVE